MSRLVRIAILASLAVAAAGGCASSSAPLTAQSSTHLRVTTAGVGLATRTSPKPFWYHVGFEVDDAIELPVRARVTFVAPGAAGEGLVVDRAITARKNHVESPKFAQRPADGTGSVTVELLSGPGADEPIDTVTQGFLTRLPSAAELRAAGLDHLAD